MSNRVQVQMQRLTQTQREEVGLQESRLREKTFAPDGAAAGAWRKARELWQRVLRARRRSPRRLRLCESLPLGERRFVAVVEFERARFLLGGTPSSLVLLSRLTDTGGGGQDEGETEAASFYLARWNRATPTTAPHREESS